MKIYIAGLGHNFQADEKPLHIPRFLTSYAALQEWFPVHNWHQLRFDYAITTHKNISGEQRPEQGVSRRKGHDRGNENIPASPARSISRGRGRTIRR